MSGRVVLSPAPCLLKQEVGPAGSASRRGAGLAPLAQRAAPQANGAAHADRPVVDSEYRPSDQLIEALRERDTLRKARLS